MSGAASGGTGAGRRRGLLVAFEGGEGSGKSTQAERLARELGALLTREPGGSAVGRRIRELVLDPDLAELDARAEALLLLADRAQHVAQVVEPALAGGGDVVTDRYSGSTLAYQGFGRGLPLEELRPLCAWAAGGLEADLVVLLDVPAEVARARARHLPDRMEGEGEAFHQRVASGYRELAAADPGRWVLVDGTGTVEAVAARVRQAVQARLGR